MVTAETIRRAQRQGWEAPVIDWARALAEHEPGATAVDRVLMAPRERACEGCGEMVLETDMGTVWILGALGMVAVGTHRDHGCARLAVAAHDEQPAKRVEEPLSREERMKRQELTAG